MYLFFSQWMSSKSTQSDNMLFIRIAILYIAKLLASFLYIRLTVSRLSHTNFFFFLETCDTLQKMNTSKTLHLFAFKSNLKINYPFNEISQWNAVDAMIFVVYTNTCHIHISVSLFSLLNHKSSIRRWPKFYRKLHYKMWS